MATTIELPQTSAIVDTQHFLLHGVTWQTYEALICALGDRAALRMNYDGENLELMTISDAHDYAKSMLGRLIELLTLELGIPIRSGGSATRKRRDVKRGLEPDECYWIANESAVRGKTNIDLTCDPPPDLAVEIEMSEKLVDRIEIYSKLGVPELWRFDGQKLRAFQLQETGAYRRIDSSVSFPFLKLEDLVPYLRPDENVDDTTRLRGFVDWIRKQQFTTE